MTILTGDFALDVTIAGLPAGIETKARNRPEADAEPAAVGGGDDGDLKLYLRHVEGGETIRSLAREVGCHPSTILRRIRRFEARRDDPLVDRAIAGRAWRDRSWSRSWSGVSTRSTNRRRL